MKKLKQQFAHKETEDELTTADKAYRSMTRKKKVNYTMKSFKKR